MVDDMFMTIKKNDEFGVLCQKIMMSLGSCVKRGWIWGPFSKDELLTDLFTYILDDIVAMFLEVATIFKGISRWTRLYKLKTYSKFGRLPTFKPAIQFHPHTTSIVPGFWLDSNVASNERMLKIMPDSGILVNVCREDLH